VGVKNPVEDYAILGDGHNHIDGLGDLLVSVLGSFLGLGGIGYFVFELSMLCSFFLRLLLGFLFFFRFEAFRAAWFSFGVSGVVPGERLR
jgi:hypothetical protein